MIFMLDSCLLLLKPCHHMHAIVSRSFEHVEFVCSSALEIVNHMFEPII